ncbi:MAG TPA: hypothetical protein VGD35_06015, partial [Chitinophaga sp.]
MTEIPRLSKRGWIFCLIVCCTWLRAAAQDQRSSDELFQDARKAAFDNKNYPLAIQLSRLAL